MSEFEENPGEIVSNNSNNSNNESPIEKAFVYSKTELLNHRPANSMEGITVDNYVYDMVTSVNKSTGNYSVLSYVQKVYSEGHIEELVDCDISQFRDLNEMLKK